MADVVQVAAMSDAAFQELLAGVVDKTIVVHLDVTWAWKDGDLAPISTEHQRSIYAVRWRISHGEIAASDVSQTGVVTVDQSLQLLDADPNCWRGPPEHEPKSRGR
jgi:hypothetical protein